MTETNADIYTYTYTADSFENMTQAEALEALADLDARHWGEQERSSSRRLNATKSRGLLINTIAHHQALDYGDALSLERIERDDRDSMESVRRGLAQSAAGSVTPFDLASLPDEAQS